MATCSQDLIEQLQDAVARLNAITFLSEKFRINLETGDPEWKIDGEWYAAIAYDDGGNKTVTLSQTPTEE